MIRSHQRRSDYVAEDVHGETIGEQELVAVRLVSRKGTKEVSLQANGYDEVSKVATRRNILYDISQRALKELSEEYYICDFTTNQRRGRRR